MHECYPWEDDEFGPFFYMEDLEKALAKEREAHPEYEFSKSEGTCWQDGEDSDWIEDRENGEYETEAYWMVRKLRT